MDIKELDWHNHIDNETGCRCRYVKSNTEYFRLHCHNYYEIFMFICGNSLHIINGSQQRLHEGQLLFIRDTDVHDYQSADGGSFEFINLAVTKETLHSLFDYLGDAFPAEALIKSEFPPTVNLTEKEKERLFYSFTELNSGAEKSLVKMNTRILLLQIFTKYFMNYEENDSDVPLWLEVTYEKMKKPQNFITGTKRMYELSQKSREHLSRSLKKYYGVTPSEYVNDLRLNHSANLLLSSNISVTEICFECGFDNLSWFYKLFKDKFGETPSQYRKKFEVTV